MSPDTGPAAEPGPGGAVVTAGDDLALIAARFGAELRAAGVPADPGRCRMEMRLLVPPLEASEMTPERYSRVWEKNWAILLAVLHQEDFPLLRSSQEGLASADAGGMLLGRNEMVNQIFHRELTRLLDGEES